MRVHELVVFMLILPQQRAPGSKWDRRRQRDVSVTTGARVGDLDDEVSKDAMSEADGLLVQRRV